MTTGQLEIGDGRCNAWKTAEGQIMTNHHCIADAFEDRCMKRFGKVETRRLRDGSIETSTTLEDSPQVRRCYHRQDQETLRSKPKSKIQVKFKVNGRMVSAQCMRVEAMNQELDYAALNCPGLSAEVPAVRFSQRPLQAREKVTLATWDFDDDRIRAQVRSGRLRTKPQNVSEDAAVQANIHIQTGNSGSAIFNEEGDVVGLANSYDNSTATSYRSGKAQFNQISAVLKHMQARFPQAHGKIQEQQKVHDQCANGSSEAGIPPVSPTHRRGVR